MKLLNEDFKDRILKKCYLEGVFTSDHMNEVINTRKEIDAVAEMTVMVMQGFTLEQSIRYLHKMGEFTELFKAALIIYDHINKDPMNIRLLKSFLELKKELFELTKGFKDKV